MKKYNESLTQYIRYKTREVAIGGIGIGGDNPVRIQSMTTTDTMDTIGTVEQTIRMVEAGCELVRITAPSINEAKNLAKIKKELLTRGYDVPLIADIHFTPNAAEEAARIVEKVRVNPGNYADKKKFQQIEYTDSEYQAEIERIRERFTPLVKICKEYGTAMRIGTNHGSLSDRIMSRYGDTPFGMVESALEFVRICEDLDYHNIVLSMKASNTQIMVQAYRLLVNKMIEEGMNYPLHLGVTEAGDGEDGRVKSAVGIGTLLEDGLGDTIRVSLTEEPEAESPVAIDLADRYLTRAEHKPIPEVNDLPYDPFVYTKRNSSAVTDIGGSNQAKVIADLSKIENITIEDFENIGFEYMPDLDKWRHLDFAPDIIIPGVEPLKFSPPHGVKIVYPYKTRLQSKNISESFPLFTFEEFNSAVKEEKSPFLNFVEMSLDNILASDKIDKSVVIVLITDNLHGMAEQRRAFYELAARGLPNPVIIKRSYQKLSYKKLMLYPATDFGGLLIDGLGDGVWLNNSTADISEIGKIIKLSFNILQACRVRISKTEYIACPSCGRTLFDLVEVTNKIRSRTEHLKGVKIGIMGCIVNGPGEMADADYGYVGSGVGKITLYRGKDVVKRGVSSEIAVDELIGIIKEDGNWVEQD
ncbi:MAG: 4-hydroxy-3-methylbut-2-en-1-yl diphosphate synthase (flavodoxin) [Melioribacteraceae bacterium]|nr:MAG: 4-hydroxy-3-methylbut-2-en-1-yl diphosphate synthase (flavodoxin) [Melioribacteraceae bacterium]